MIVLREHERIKVGEHWDNGKKMVGQQQMDKLLHHQDRNGIPLFEPGYKSLKASSWVGTLGLGDHCLDVIPKIDDATGTVDDRQTRKNLLWMASRAGLMPIAEADIAPLTRSPQTLLAAFLQLYIQKLSIEWQRGPIRQYISEEENRTYLKGKWLFPEHVRRNMVHKHRFYTLADEFVTDNPMSGLLKAALRKCALQVFNADSAREAKRLLLEFTDVKDRVFSEHEMDLVQVSRQHQRFELLIRLAKMILRSSSPGQYGESVPIYSLMFDMNVVFERFIASELQTALAGSGLTVKVQVSGHSLLKKEGKSKFQLKPDIGIYRGKEIICLVDTKWKRLDPKKSHFGVTQADMYQAYAYGKEFKSPMTLLLYPRWGNLPATVAEYHHNSSDETPERKITIKTIPISQADGTMESVFNLRNELLEIVNLK
jgi:5-methylcytosine-specific restriction enzyme subunit McrC